jgi:hypothetical protein
MRSFPFESAHGGLPAPPLAQTMRGHAGLSVHPDRAGPSRRARDLRRFPHESGWTRSAEQRGNPYIYGGLFKPRPPRQLMPRQATFARFKPNWRRAISPPVGRSHPPSLRPSARSGLRLRARALVGSGFCLDQITKARKVVCYQPAELAAHDRLGDSEGTAGRALIDCVSSVPVSVGLRTYCSSKAAGPAIPDPPQRCGGSQLFTL